MSNQIHRLRAALPSSVTPAALAAGSSSSQLEGECSHVPPYRLTCKNNVLGFLWLISSTDSYKTLSTRSNAIKHQHFGQLDFPFISKGKNTLLNIPSQRHCTSLATFWFKVHCSIVSKQQDERLAMFNFPFSLQLLNKGIKDSKRNLRKCWT